MVNINETSCLPVDDSGSCSRVSVLPNPADEISICDRAALFLHENALATFGIGIIMYVCFSFFLIVLDKKASGPAAYAAADLYVCAPLLISDSLNPVPDGAASRAAWASSESEGCYAD
ncbi:hypothetical protein SAMN05660330_02305 [Desulforhopalus singaporensis]|uniref:Uncharacterized protein n=1 Tax=Desulforhopalus singaporensis TaxID=91360 RepID=A0A1H0RJQ9_9BACT|nr:hypothetical protein SAMN05660330_02305 [Desulforhopalus singaporensis]